MLTFVDLVNVIEYLPIIEALKFPTVSKKCEAACLGSTIVPLTCKSYRELQLFITKFRNMKIVRAPFGVISMLDAEVLSHFQSVEISDFHYNSNYAILKALPHFVREKLNVEIQRVDENKLNNLEKLFVHASYFKQIKNVRFPHLKFLKLEDVDLENISQLNGLNEFCPKCKIYATIYLGNELANEKTKAKLATVVSKYHHIVNFSIFGGGYLDSPMGTQDIKLFDLSQDDFTALHTYFNLSFTDTLKMSCLKLLKSPVDLRAVEFNEFVIDTDDKKRVLLPKGVKRVIVEKEMENVFENVLIDNFEELHELQKIVTYGDLKMPLKYESIETVKMCRKERDRESEVWWYRDILKMVGWYNIFSLLFIVLFAPQLTLFLKLVKFHNIGNSLFLLMNNMSLAVMKATAENIDIKEFILFVFYSLFSFEMTFFIFVQDFYSPSTLFQVVISLVSGITLSILPFSEEFMVLGYSNELLSKLVRARCRTIMLPKCLASTFVEVFLNIKRSSLWRKVLLLTILSAFLALEMSYCFLALYPLSVFHYINTTLLVLPLLHIVAS
ncbi:hypothetical protein EIN_093510 [Entamoeba invadens IP1]|uniref:Uncharacterized protein n=1 Tax=Entamoeba invadens IP1 TaxID=370355 RepID=A0A0A1TZY8_ENTIV|nr:hypothetical protein EIN_093510 [Entamoeba invadens IP1]ELP87194.1 hypothetical protein EIN_093510 [Entamoeba invadens IP1]|eukprot:XP_004253965.1 hypothetical protein EIN_093510 [Entamoeba invadens IP1]